MNRLIDTLSWNIGIIDYLTNYQTNDQILCEELLNILSCSKDLKKIVSLQLIKHYRFNLSTLIGWKKQRFDLVHFINIDVNEFEQLPRFTKELHFTRAYNKLLTPGLLPDTITKIFFDDNYYYPLIVDTLPANLQHIEMYSTYVFKDELIKQCMSKRCGQIKCVFRQIKLNFNHPVKEFIWCIKNRSSPPDHVTQPNNTI